MWNSKPPKFNERDTQNYTDIQIEFSMTKKILLYEREAYTFFNLLEDFGGFTGSIIMVSSFIMSFYSERMYLKSIAQQRPLETASFDSQVKE